MGNKPYQPTVSQRHDWKTPQWLFDSLNSEFNFTLDVCADKGNSKCKEFLTDGAKKLSKD